MMNVSLSCHLSFLWSCILGTVRLDSHHCFISPQAVRWRSPSFWTWCTSIRSRRRFQRRSSRRSKATTQRVGAWSRHETWSTSCSAGESVSVRAKVSRTSQGWRHGATIGVKRIIWSRYFPCNAYKHNVKRGKNCGGTGSPVPPPCAADNAYKPVLVDFFLSPSLNNVYVYLLMKGVWKVVSILY